MVRSAERRKAKYEAKVDADVFRSRILAQKTAMVTNMESAAADLATTEAEVKRVIENMTTPVYGHSIPAYLNVGRQLYKLSKKFSGATLNAEAQTVLVKWKAKGLDHHGLVEIAKLFGITYP
jgi:hypothetical protein